ncbi:MAG TPA: hypothetical protein VMK12_32260 [Anaeromyxobacteraceae bacterium]|nr:hypothetical protein [Anaeromyxobacteraceae bacterium]
MTSIGRVLLIVVALAAAAPALGQYYPPPPYRVYRPPPENALRVEIGGASLSSRYCPDGSGSCFSSDPWGALALGVDLDLALGRSPISLTLGAHEMLAPYYSGSPNVFEPWLGLTFKPLRYAPVEPRLSIGGAGLIGNNGDTGGALRVGGGLSFFGSAFVGLAVDLMFDYGHIGAVDLFQVELALGPEFRF